MDFDQQDLMMTMVMTQMDKLPGFHPDIPGSSADHRFPLSMMSVDPTLSSRPPPSISFSGGAATASSSGDAMGTMREMIFRMAVMQPVHIDPESVKPPKRRNVRISKDPQSVAARHRRERISERIRILQRLVPGGTKMDTASMLDEAIHYVKFLKSQVQSLECANGTNRAVPPPSLGLGFPVVGMSNGCSGSTNYLPTTKASYHR